MRGLFSFINNTMRIISGKYKGRRFDVPHTFKARPTTDFAKESLFNILVNNYADFDEMPKALDLFAGTGSISLELLSRGCGSVVAVEKDFKHWQYLHKLAHDLGDNAWKVLHADVKNVLTANKKDGGGANTFDIIFADPPYALEWLGELPDMVFASGLLNEADDSLFILEHGRDYDFKEHPRFVEHRNYGSVNFTFFK